MESRKNAEQGVGRGIRGRFRREWAVCLFFLLMATALPALVALVGGLVSKAAQAQVSEDTMIQMIRHGQEGEERDEREEMTLERVITLSLAATNESQTPEQSLAAQAILLRSRAIWWMGYCSMEEADVKTKEITEDLSVNASAPILCDSPVHGLPYLSQEELEDRWGQEEAAARIKASCAAVEETRGRVLCYEGKIIPAILHNSSPGSTRNEQSLPWLTAVSTPEEGAWRRFPISAQETRLTLAAEFGLSLPEDPADWKITVEAASAGWVERVKIGNEEVSGNAFAEALALPSACFDLLIEGDRLIVTVLGEGSGCGLSREGAAIYAKSGLSWMEILAHYYPECAVTRI